MRLAMSLLVFTLSLNLGSILPGQPAAALETLLALPVAAVETPAAAAAVVPQRPSPDPVPILTDTWYVRFRVDNTPPEFHLPALLVFHADGTFSAVDGGDFGALPDLPFNQTSQYGTWEWLGGNKYLAKGLIFSFSRVAGSEGQLVNILGTEIEIDLEAGHDAFTAVVTQHMWICPDTFFCPDPLTDAPDMTIPADQAGFWVEGRRVK